MTVFAHDIAQAVNTGSTTAKSVAERTVERVARYDRVQPQVWISRFDAALVVDAAEAVDARIARGEVLPLAGVPFAVKDNIDVAGLPTTAACPAFAYYPDVSAFTVNALIEAGAICIGKTNLDQFATGLVGTRSPYGAPHCAYNQDYISGGSSSGSAIAVAAGLVAFALGTDTAGSGRVPAAFNGLVGFKPTRGRWSNTGVVPACRSLDCVTVFTNCADDARMVDAVVSGFDSADYFSRSVADRPVGRRLGMALSGQIDWHGDDQSAKLYAQALEQLFGLGFELIGVDIAPLLGAGALLYDGPWLAERAIAAGPLLQSNREALDPVVADIIERAFEISGTAVFEGQYALACHRQSTDRLWTSVDALVLPTTPTIFSIEAIAQSPVLLNSILGRYTNFVNLLDLAAIAVPAGWRDDGTGFGISMIAPAGTDLALLDVAARCSRTAVFAPPPLAGKESPI
jgi:allophanate hydrolase